MSEGRGAATEVMECGVCRRDRRSRVAAVGRCTARNTTQQERRNTLEFFGEIAISYPKL
jgi:hypothetical protein